MRDDQYADAAPNAADLRADEYDDVFESREAYEKWEQSDQLLALIRENDGISDIDEAASATYWHRWVRPNDDDSEGQAA